MYFKQEKLKTDLDSPPKMLKKQLSQINQKQRIMTLESQLRIEKQQLQSTMKRVNQMNQQLDKIYHLVKEQKGIKYRSKSNIHIKSGLEDVAKVAIRKALRDVLYEYQK